VVGFQVNSVHSIFESATLRTLNNMVSYLYSIFRQCFPTNSQHFPTGFIVVKRGVNICVQNKHKLNAKLLQDYTFNYTCRGG
ncbi:MAG: hypothetical protein WBV81_06790, partial [Ignavibacteriaceae bacterium]